MAGTYWTRSPHNPEWSSKHICKDCGVNWVCRPQSHRTLTWNTCYIINISQVGPYFFLLITVEAIVRWLQSKPLPRKNDSINSISNGIVMELARIVIGAFEVSTYAWVYHNFCVINLPWNSALVWWLAFFGVDFGYYWFHRMGHGEF